MTPETKEEWIKEAKELINFPRGTQPANLNDFGRMYFLKGIELYEAAVKEKIEENKKKGISDLEKVHNAYLDNFIELLSTCNPPVK